MNTRLKTKEFFDNVFDEFVKAVENKFTVGWGILFEKLKRKALVNDSERIFPFLKYFNIWNTPKSDKGKIEFYADFVHSNEKYISEGKEKITNNRSKILIGKKGAAIFDETHTRTIGKGFRNKKIFDEIYEFVIKQNSPSITNFDYYSKSSPETEFEHSENLNNLFDDIDDDNSFSQNKYEAWLKALQECYPVDSGDNKVTNFFFLIGPVFFGSNKDDDEKELQSYIISANIGIQYDANDTTQKTAIQDFLKQLKIFINKLTFLIILRLKEESLMEQATRAALAQVMTRNLSHNIGSHVLVKVISIWLESFVTGIAKKQNTSTLEVKPEKTILEICEKFQDFGEKLKGCNDSCTCEKFAQKFADDFKEYFNGYDLISTLLNYLKIRFDYLADITTGTAIMENPQSIKSVIAEFERNGLLANTISGIDNFRYKIVFENAIDSDNTKDLNISVPNDVLGNHAFYTILENIIRNAAKHGKSQEVDFVVKIEEASKCINESRACDVVKNEAKEMYAVSIIIKNYDVENHTTQNLSDDEIKQFKAELKNDEDFQTIEGAKERIDAFKGESKLEYTVIKLNHQINKSVLKDNQLRQGSWGLLEMEASAAYLRKIPMENIENDEYQLEVFTENENNPQLYGHSLSKEKESINILKAYIADEKHLAYRFFVYKPREVLIVGDCGITADKDELQKEGIQIIDKLQKNKVYPHKLIINCTDNDINPSPNITRRIVKYNEKCCNCSNKQETKNFIKEQVKSIGQGIADDNNSNHNVQNLKEEYFKKLKKFKDSNADLFCEIEMSSTKSYFNQDGWKPWNAEFIKTDRKIKIMVVDERIQSFAQEKYKEIGNYTIYRYTNVFVPVKQEYTYDQYCDFEVEKCSVPVNLNEQNFDKNCEDIIKYIQTGKDMEFIVIHLGIIEKLIKSYKIKHYRTSTKEDISNFIKEAICKKNDADIIDYDRIIIISGRGNPHNLPDDIRYLNFSVVNTYLTDKRNKYAFAEACYAARKKSDNNNKK